MASTFAMSESYGASPTVTDTTKLNLLAADIASGSDETTVPNANPIAIPGAGYAYSYERWCRGHFTGSFTSITSVYFWKYSGTLSGSIKIKAKVKTPSPTVYVQSINTASTYAGASGNEATATNDIPVATGTLNPAYLTNYTDYIILQLVVPSGSASGSIGTMTYRFGWNEV